MTGIGPYAVFAVLLFAIGLYCLLTNRNTVKMLIGAEVMTKSVVLMFSAAGFFRGDTLLSQSLVISFIVVEVSLVAVALTIVINAYRNTGTLDVSSLTRLKG